MRLHIALFGRTNVGKSSFLNMISGQDIAITSPLPGTTTDVVEKTMELLPLGPIVFLDTAGFNDTTELADARLRKTTGTFRRAEIVVILCENGIWGKPETHIMRLAAEYKLPVVAVINKIDTNPAAPGFMEKLKAEGALAVIAVSSIVPTQREAGLSAFKQALLTVCPEDFIQPPPLVGDLLRPGGLAVLIVPIDLQAPKGRLILPQVQTIRDALDNDASVLVVKEREYAHLLEQLKTPPDLTVCDSQVVMKMVADTPKSIPCTTFSILFSRLKGDMQLLARGVAAIEQIQHGDKILIAEACSHHAAADDIGRVKIPRWLRQYLGADIEIDVYAGRDYPENLAEYSLVVHCGSCMLNRHETLARLQLAEHAGVPVTNYGMCIAYVQGVIERVLTPFPAALDAFQSARNG